MMYSLYIRFVRDRILHWMPSCKASLISCTILLIVFSPGLVNSEDSSGPQSEQKAVLTPQGTPKDGEAEARKHFEIGTQAIRLKQWDNAIAKLEQAVKLSPKNSVYHHALGVAYMGNKQPNAGWYHFRKAIRLDPQNGTATLDFMTTWKLLDAQGVFNVGNSLKRVAQTLGKPDQVDDRETRLRLVYGFMSLNFVNGKLFSILDLRNLPPKGLNAAEGMAFSLPESQWAVAYRILSANQGNTEYVKQGETIQAWTELFSSQRFIDAAQEKTAANMMNDIRKKLEAHFKEVSFEVLNQSDQDVLFVWSIQQNDQHPAQQEVVRIVQGKYDIHRLAYTRKGASQEAQTLEPWMKVLVQAKLLSAKKLREHLTEQQQKKQEAQLRDISRQILNKQFEFIREKDIQSLKLFFTEDLREKITPEILGQVRPYLDDLLVEELIDHVQISKENGTLKAQLIDKQGEIFTTLIQTNKRWFAETIWFEALVK